MAIIGSVYPNMGGWGLSESIERDPQKALFEPGNLALIKTVPSNLSLYIPFGRDHTLSFFPLQQLSKW